MNQLRVTTTQSTLAAESRRGFNAAAFLAGKDRLTYLAMIVAGLALLVAALTAGMPLLRPQPPLIFVVLDPNGNVIVAPGLPFAEARELHSQQSLLAAMALLSRNPKDFDQPELLQAIFSPAALAQARSLRAAEAPEFESRQIHQKPQVTRIEAITTRQGDVQAQLTGQLFRFGTVQQARFNDAVPFSLHLVLKPNLDLLHNRRQPLVVTQFTLHYEPAAHN